MNITKAPIEKKQFTVTHGCRKHQERERGDNVRTSMTMARSTTMLVTYPRTRLMTPLATDDEPISTSICSKNLVNPSESQRLQQIREV